MIRRASVLLVVALVVLGACSGRSDNGDPAGPSQTGSAATQEDLDGLTFLALPSDGIDPAVSISFWDGGLTYRSTCNSHSGDYEIDNGALRFEVGRVTLVGCEEPESMSVVNELLGSEPSLRFDPPGTLTIVGTDRTLVVRSDTIADPTQSVLGEWRVASVLLGVGGRTTWALTSASVVLEAGAIVINGPCTTGTATAEFQDRQLTVAALEFEPGACDEQGTEIEAALLAVFGGPTDDTPASFRIVTTTSGIRLEPTVTPAPNDLRPSGLSLTPMT